MFKVISLMTIIYFSMMFSPAFAQQNIALVFKVEGKIKVIPSELAKSKNLQRGFILKDGDKVETGSASFCIIKFLDDKSVLRIQENSSCMIEGHKKGNYINKNIFVKSGTFWIESFSRAGGIFQITTHTSIALTKNAKFWTLQNKKSGETQFFLIKGEMEVKNKIRKILLREGQTAYIASRLKIPEVKLTDKDNIPSHKENDPSTQILDIGFSNGSNRIKVLRIQIQN